jgi:hypothetical protein
MVFCGKPSKGCKHCRIRRIKVRSYTPLSPRHFASTLIPYGLKCDQIDPACSQCLRAGKECPGYRDQLSLLFRDESEKVVRKAKVPRGTPEHRKSSTGQTQLKNGPDRSASTSPPSSATPPSGSSRALVALNPSLQRRSLSPTQFGLDDGVVFFFDNYVTLNSNYPSGNINMPKRPVMQSMFANHAFYNAVSSVGYAGLSNVTKNPGLMLVARKKYATSLRDITRALKDTSTADLDTAFKSVMLLAAFEVSSEENLQN